MRASFSKGRPECIIFIFELLTFFGFFGFFCLKGAANDEVVNLQAFLTTLLSHIILR